MAANIKTLQAKLDETRWVNETVLVGARLLSYFVLFTLLKGTNIDRTLMFGLAWQSGMWCTKIMRERDLHIHLLNEIQGSIAQLSPERVNSDHIWKLDRQIDIIREHLDRQSVKIGALGTSVAVGCLLVAYQARSSIIHAGIDSYARCLARRN